MKIDRLRVGNAYRKQVARTIEFSERVVKRNTLAQQVRILPDQMLTAELFCISFSVSSKGYVSMSTALTVYQRNDFAAIAEGSEVQLALSENMLDGEGFSEMDLIRVKMPSGGGLHWTVEGDPAPVGEIEGVLVFNCWLGLLWPSLETGSGVKPLVRSNDLITGCLNMTDDEIADAIGKGVLKQQMVDELKTFEIDGQPGCYPWKDLPWTQQGTGKDGIGKFAKENRLLFILRKGDAWPLVLKATPGSLSAVSKMIKRLVVPQYRAVVNFKLKVSKSRNGKDFSEIVCSQVGQLDAETGELVKKTYTDRLRESHNAGRSYEDVTETVED